MSWAKSSRRKARNKPRSGRRISVKALCVDMRFGKPGVRGFARTRMPLWLGQVTWLAVVTRTLAASPMVSLRRWADWLSSMDGGAATSAYAPLLGGWVKNDPVAASEYVASMPPSESRDWAIGGMVHSHRWEDPTAAIVWANELSSAEGREKVMTLAAEAYVRKDPAAAAEWLPTSGLPIETQERLQAGREGK